MVPEHPAEEDLNTPDRDPSEGFSEGRWLTPAAFVLVLIGLILRVRAYLSNRSLWLDEAMLARDLMAAPVLGPLAEQQAPPGFIAVQGVVWRMLGTSEYAFRLFPLLAGAAAVLLIFMAVRRALDADAPSGGKSTGAGFGGLLALVLLAVSGPAIYYSGELKQYALDVLASVIVLGGWPLLRGEPSRRLWAFSGLCAILVWFSHPALFTILGIWLAATLATLATSATGGLRPALPLARAAIPWVASAGLFFLSLRRYPTPDWVVEYWAPHFVPWSEGAVAVLEWLARAAVNLFRRSLGLNPWWLSWPVFAVSALWMLRRRPALLTACLLPPLLALAAAAAHVYPFRGRLLLFALPLILTVIGGGLGGMLASRRCRWAGAVTAIAVLLLPAAGALRDLASPRTVQEMRPAVTFLMEQPDSDAAIYVYWHARPAFDYYADRLGFTAALRVDGSNWADETNFDADLEMILRHGAPWVLMSHVRPGERERYESAIAGRMRVTAFHEWPGVLLWRLERSGS